jgi:hypothetical protein
MSGSETTANAASDPREGKDRDLQGRSLRFTPLRSQLMRARTLTRDARGDLALSRLIPAPRL